MRKKRNKREEIWGMENEGTRMLGLPFTPTLPISSCRSTQKGYFGQEERM
jgi:hypothetical protein